MRMWIWNGKFVDGAALCELLGNVCNEHSRDRQGRSL
jgi:hypothetical protein